MAIRAINPNGSYGYSRPSSQNISEQRHNDDNKLKNFKRPKIGVMRFEGGEMSPRARQFEKDKGGILA